MTQGSSSSRCELTLKLHDSRINLDYAGFQNTQVRHGESRLVDDLRHGLCLPRHFMAATGGEMLLPKTDVAQSFLLLRLFGVIDSEGAMTIATSA